MCGGGEEDTCGMKDQTTVSVYARDRLLPIHLSLQVRS